MHTQQPESHGTFRPGLQRSRILGYWTMDVSPNVVDATGDGKIISWIQVSTPGGSQKNAFSHGYKGAMFPWSPSAEGSEDTLACGRLPVPFSTTSPDVLGGRSGNITRWPKTKHGSGKGLAGAKRSSRFWANQVERNGPGRYDINNVIGANEWQENIDNNAFTNGMAITALRYAVQAATESSPDPDWSHVADNIPILKFPDGTTKENATYDGVDIKQADANLLSYPLEIVTDAAKVRQDLNYYQPRYSKEGPAMGAAILAVLYCRLGDYNKARGWNFFFQL